MTEVEVIGRADHYAEFVQLVRARIAALGVTHATVDEIAGFPAGYTSTLLCGTKNMSAFSLFTIARSLALAPAFFHDDAELQKLNARSNWIKGRRPGPRDRRRLGGLSGEHSGERNVLFNRKRFMKHIAARGVLGRMLKLTPERRRGKGALAIVGALSLTTVRLP
jgi:hypothetical protein